MTSRQAQVEQRHGPMRCYRTTACYSLATVRVSNTVRRHEASIESDTGGRVRPPTLVQKLGVRRSSRVSLGGVNVIALMVAS